MAVYKPLGTWRVEIQSRRLGEKRLVKNGRDRDVNESSIRNDLYILRNLFKYPKVFFAF